MQQAVEQGYECASAPGTITLWRVDSAAVLEFVAPGEPPWRVALSPLHACLVLAGRGQFRCLGGPVHCVSLPCASLARLLAFVDAPGAPSLLPLAQTPRLALPLPLAAAAGGKALQYCLLASVLRRETTLQPLLSLLRQQESYSLVRFLDWRACATGSVAALGGEYGLSYSHFRRLCRQALGVGVKAAFKRWRAARALLRVVDGGISLTAAALDSGYSSSSQFSTEVRTLFGRSPRSLLAPRW